MIGVSGLGFHYASRHATDVKALAFMEAIVKPISWRDFPLGPRIGFQLFRTTAIGWFMLSVMNMFVHQIMPQMTIRKLSTEEKARYLAPFPTNREPQTGAAMALRNSSRRQAGGYARPCRSIQQDLAGVRIAQAAVLCASRGSDQR